MYIININDLDYIAKGSAFLGSGGGGDPLYDLMIAKHTLMQKNHGVPLYNLEELNNDDLIVSCCLMGVPTVAKEKLFNLSNWSSIITTIENLERKNVRGIFGAEIGGANAFPPIYVATHFNLPVVDCDFSGRAFPELQMSSINVLNGKLNRTIITDAFNNIFILECKDYPNLEKYARALTVACGSVVAMAYTYFTVKQAKQYTISGSYNRAINIGKYLSTYAQDKNLNNFTINTGSKLIFEGTIIDINHQVDNGFVSGKLTIRNNTNIEIVVIIQNEFLFIYHDKEIIAETPDIISIIETETGNILSSSNVYFGAKVSVLTLNAPNIWYTARGLQLVGREKFL